MSGLQKPDAFTTALVAAYEIMKSKDRVMEHGEIELEDGRTFSYKIREVQTKGERVNDLF